MDQRDRYQLRQVLMKEELFTLAARIKDNFPYCLQRQGMSIYCAEEEVALLGKVLKGSDFLSIVREAPVDIGFLADYQVGPVLDTLQRRLQMRLLDKPDNAYAYITQQTHLLRCPAGMKVQRLGRAGVQRMLQANDYWSSIPLDLACKLAENLPALGIYLDPEIVDETLIDTNDLSPAEPEATPIAWVCTNSYGSVSMLRTEDKYRRLGLASLLVQILGRLLLVEGYFPNAIVLERNDASAAVFNKLIGWKRTHCAHWVLPDVTR
ncbi:uncharacterized protein [Macrobrachium rosenbergii]|uniref:uncharacterized protein n=1 Tax=Macrobrachium rosenbergii TaxID=79674 RepID=UPI0034D59A28